MGERIVINHRWTGYIRCIVWGMLGALAVLPGCTLIQTTANSGGLHDQLAAKQQETAQAQTAALDLWDRIIVGEIVSCQESIPVPRPLQLADRDLGNYPAASAVQTHLNAAIQAVRNSSDLWNIECAEDRPYVPLSMAREGRATALAASEPLAKAARLLAEW